MTTKLIEKGKITGVNIHKANTTQSLLLSGFKQIMDNLADIDNNKLRAIYCYDYLSVEDFSKKYAGKYRDSLIDPFKAIQPQNYYKNAFVSLGIGFSFATYDMQGRYLDSRPDIRKYAEKHESTFFILTVCHLTEARQDSYSLKPVQPIVIALLIKRAIYAIGTILDSVNKARKKA